MAQRIFEYFVCLMAIYGLYALIRSLIGMICCRISGKHPNVRVILLVKDAEEHIEYIIRNIANKDLKAKVLSNRNVAIVDMGSSDRTQLLLERLQKDFQNIDILTYENRMQMFEDF